VNGFFDYKTTIEYYFVKTIKYIKSNDCLCEDNQTTNYLTL